MPLDPQSEAVLARQASWPKPDDSVAGARALEQRRFDELSGPLEPMAEVRDLALPTPDGEVPARAYLPRVERPPGALVWFHGGGWVIGSVAQAEDQARALAAASGCAVLSVDYRLAPEHRFPAAVTDAVAAVAWAAGNAGALGAGDGLAVGGESAGAGLAAAATLVARERGGPRIDLQLLVYPLLARVLDTESRRRFSDGPLLTAEGIESCWRHYVGDGDDARHPLASPLLAESHADLPPAYVATAEYDLLRGDGELYAQRLEAAGVPVELRHWDGLVHGFFGCRGAIDRAVEAVDAAGRAVGAALGRRVIP